MQRLDLNGQWDFVADLDPKYHLDPRIYPHPEYARPDTNRRHWLKVMVPGVWQKYAERYDIYEGVCWFARAFELPALAPRALARLRFGAVNYACRVFLNGIELGGHEGGYTEFTLDARRALQPGENLLAVMVDNRATTTKWPPCLGYFNYGGIHRDVTLEWSETPCLDDLALTAEPAAGGGTLRVAGRVLLAEPGLQVRVACAGAEGAWAVTEEGAFSGELAVAGVKPWSPDAPQLYPVKITLLRGAERLDERAFQCGFRRLALREGYIHLNDEEIRLKGICYVYDSPVHGLVMAPEQVEADVRLMKELGCNAVRCHYPQHERFYAACDRAGLLVWIEPPVYCLHPRDDERGTPFANPAWLALAEGMLSEMVRTARNHPSVAIYSLGNECNTHNPEAEPFFRRLAARLRAEDPTRLISYAALYGLVGPLAELVDVLGINSYWGWYDKVLGGKGLKPADEAQAARDVPVEPINLAPMRQMLDQVLARKPDLALLLTEFGADSVAGFYSRSRDLWSEDYHAALLKEIFALVREYPQIVGTFPFCFSDYRDPSKVHNGYWNELNLKGVVTYVRRKKLAFAAVQEAYRPT